MGIMIINSDKDGRVNVQFALVESIGRRSERVTASFVYVLALLWSAGALNRFVPCQAAEEKRTLLSISKGRELSCTEK